jgi:Flp pilus assembly protein CpaB
MFEKDYGPSSTKEQAPMTDTSLLAQRGTATVTNGRDSSGRKLDRRRPLPGGRALVGGFLVAASAVGVFAAYNGATGDHRRPFVVAARPLAVGARITRGDVTVGRMQLSDASAAHAFARADSVVGRVLIAPLAPGELLQSSAVLPRDAAPAGTREVSFTVDAAQVTGVQPGEPVDVFVTDGTAGGARTTLVVERAPVVRLGATRSAISSSLSVVVTLALSSPADVQAVVHASRTGQITLVRSAGAASS